MVPLGMHIEGPPRSWLYCRRLGHADTKSIKGPSHLTSFSSSSEKRARRRGRGASGRRQKAEALRVLTKTFLDFKAHSTFKVCW
jgi:hypothetical protein